MSNPERSGGEDTSAIPDTLATLYRSEYIGRATTLRQLDAVRKNLNWLDNFARTDDPLSRQMHMLDTEDSNVERLLLIRRWPYEKTRYIAEVIMTDRIYNRDDCDDIITSIFRMDVADETFTFETTTHTGYATTDSLILPEVASSTIWWNAQGEISLECGSVDIQAAPKDVLENIDSFLMAKIKVPELYNIIHSLGSHTLMTSLQFAPE